MPADSERRGCRYHSSSVGSPNGPGQHTPAVVWRADPALPTPAVPPGGCNSAPLTRFPVCLLAGHTGDNLLAAPEQANT
jgi:hypothetical protein